MLVRKVATFIRLLIQQIKHVGGQIILTPASMSCVKIEDKGDFYRCYFENTDGERTIEQEFVVGDLARAQTFNVKEGVIQEALVETIGCSGMTHSAAMASEILPGLTILEALNTDLVCDAINTAMRELFLQIVYGRSQSAFSEDGLVVGAGLEDLGKGLRSQVGTMYGTLKKGPRYLEMAEGYVTGIALDEDNEIIGYQFVSLGKMTDFIKKGDDPNTAWEKAKGQYGRVADAVKIIDPRTDEEVK